MNKGIPNKYKNNPELLKKDLEDLKQNYHKKANHALEHNHYDAHEYFSGCVTGVDRIIMLLFGP
jgi:hypothetical protein